MSLPHDGDARLRSHIRHTMEQLRGAAIITDRPRAEEILCSAVAHFINAMTVHKKQIQDVESWTLAFIRSEDNDEG